MAQAGWTVTVLEKHATAGGRARQLKAEGFTFDMGPSWYWMPDVFERFFGQFGKKVSDYYRLTRLDPSYRVYWPEGHTNLPASYDELRNLFESIEKGSAARLDHYLDEAATKYAIGMQELVYKPGRNLSEFADWKIVRNMFRLDIFTSIKSTWRGISRTRSCGRSWSFPCFFSAPFPKTPRPCTA